MSRALWKGSIAFGLVQIPVSLHSAEDAEGGLDFRLLDKRDMSPIRYERVSDKSGDPVAWENIVKGYEYEEGQYVVLSPADLKRANVEATQTVDIVEFVDASQVPAIFYERPYYLAPVKKGNKAYVLLRETLARTGKIGIAKVVIRTRQHIASVYPMGDVIVVHLLRYGHELRDTSDLPLPRESLKELGVSERELAMAEQLVDSMSGDWDPTEFHDEYRDDLLAHIQRKVKEGETEEVEEKVPEKKPRGEVVDIMGLLKKSLEQGAAPKTGKAVERAHAHARREKRRRPRTAARKSA